MTTFRLSAVAVACLALSLTTARAQFAFGIESSCSPDDAYAKVTLPAATFAEIVKNTTEGIPAKDLCLAGTPAGVLKGYQADYDGDGKEEMWLLFSTDAGCNALAAVASESAGKYKVLDVMPLPAGKALIRPIIVLGSGVQMYVQCMYKLPDGTPETKGAVFGMKQGSFQILTSWTQKNYTKDGKPYLQDVRAAFADLNYDGVRELLVRYNTHETAGKITKKSLVDSYVLTLDYTTDHLRYNVYDSAGFDKVGKAEAMASAGQRMLGKEETRTDGIVKIREALALDPFMTKARVKLGQFFLMNGKYGDAEKTLLIARDLDPEYPKTWKLLGDTYLRLNDLQKCLAVYNQFLKLSPGQSMDRNQVMQNVNKITKPRGRH